MSDLFAPPTIEEIEVRKEKRISECPHDRVRAAILRSRYIDGTYKDKRVEQEREWFLECQRCGWKSKYQQYTREEALAQLYDLCHPDRVRNYAIRCL